jgi:hypothetical protein
MEGPKWRMRRAMRRRKRVMSLEAWAKEEAVACASASVIVVVGGGGGAAAVVVEEEEEEKVQAKDNRRKAFSICPNPSSAYFLTNTHSASSALNSLLSPSLPPPLPPPPAAVKEARAGACEWAVARETRCFHTNISLRVSPYTWASRARRLLQDKERQSRCSWL